MSGRRVVIVGAGIAGAATAYFLAQRGQRVIVLDRERTPGVHSTGRNAAILRTAIPEPELHALAADSRRFYAAPPPGFSEVPLFESVGLYLGAPADAADALRAWTSRPSVPMAVRRFRPSSFTRPTRSWPASSR